MWYPQPLQISQLSVQKPCCALLQIRLHSCSRAKLWTTKLTAERQDARLRSSGNSFLQNPCFIEEADVLGYQQQLRLATLLLRPVVHRHGGPGKHLFLFQFRLQLWLVTLQVNTTELSSQFSKLQFASLDKSIAS